ncbi:hypothetical protein PBAC_24400 [Pedobacter glucosidilyticus]|uniref:Lipoprotein n=1 Tax=Pedobacter aquae TaxID=2605747 RepID=A0A5C0VLE9_9SPHI|nr:MULTISPECIES: DUF6252 family protein [Pedobacter]KHJ37372.1 hypothetical protein PBAC_24400 [Pedobacter glucosidilyticus]QEK51804.1 hypothetical protein FYC62_09200 [Pedobacter aquae]
MKNLIKLITCLPVIIFLSAASCKKDEIDTGFTCKVNGERWRPFANDFKLQETECHLTNNGETLFIKARNTNSREHLGILVSTPGILISTKYYTINSNMFLSGTYDSNSSGPGDYFQTNSSYTGQVEIKSIDTVNKRMTGTFFYDAYNEKTKQTVKITSGTFNLKYVNF